MSNLDYFWITTWAVVLPIILAFMTNSLKKIKHQTKPSNGTTMAHTVEHMQHDITDIKREVAAIAVHVGYKERRK